MFDPRIYRAAFIPAFAALVALLFSLEPAPRPIERAISTPAFDAREAARTARAITSLAPSREPGSSGDRATADLVRERMSAVRGGTVSVQTFDGTLDGEDVELQNVLLTLPGSSQEGLLIVAPRDSAGPDPTGTAAETAALLGIADALGGTRHERTIVLASTTGSTQGGAGVRELVRALPAPDGINAAIAVSQPGVRQPVPPFVIASGPSSDSPSIQLVRTAEEIALTQFGEPGGEPGGIWRGFARLVVPFGIGEQSALIGEGVDAVTISAAGERAPEAAADARVSPETMLAAANTAIGLLLALDEAPAPPEAGPGDYLRTGDELIPAWPLAALGLGLVLPALLAAGDGWLRERRRDRRASRKSLPWVLERALLPLAALVGVYLLELFGVLPDPGFPYEPAAHSPGTTGVVVAVVLVLLVLLAGLLVRPMRVPTLAEPQALASAAGLVLAGSVAAIWFLNPYLALLLSPAAHVWLLPARAIEPSRRSVVGALAVASLLPVAAAALTVTSALELGFEGPWHLLLLITSGQIGLLTALLACGVIGGLVACVAAAGSRPITVPEPDRVRVRGPTGYAGPGSLGGTPSTLPRR
jgi:hypothetical protein